MAENGYACRQLPRSLAPLWAVRAVLRKRFRGAARFLSAISRGSSPPHQQPLFAARRPDLPSRMINKEIFENELPFAALKRPTTVRALNLTVGRRRISFDSNQLVLRTTVWTFE
jgi:hypothetical protein